MDSSKLTERKSWLFGPAVNAIMQAFRPLGPPLRGQEVMKMLQCT